MEEEHPTVNNDDNSTDISPITSLLNSSRLPMRRGILRQTTTLRSLPYNATLSYLRQRQMSLTVSQNVSNLISNTDNHSIHSDVNTSSIEQDEFEILLPETEVAENNIFVTSEDENENDSFEVLVDFSHAPSTDLMITNGELMGKFYIFVEINPL